jgi:hypothetical protein
MESDEEIISNARAPCGYLAARAVTKVKPTAGTKAGSPDLAVPPGYCVGVIELSQVVIAFALTRTTASA